MWYRKGLRFQCLQCGRCCSSYPGYVWLCQKDISNISLFLNCSEKTFLKIYTLIAPNGKISLREKPHSYDCIFYDNKRCKIYPQRPIQCQTFPWWPSILSSQKHFEEIASFCLGINERAPLISFKTIQKALCFYLSSKKECKD